VGSNLSYH